MISKFLRSV